MKNSLANLSATAAALLLTSCASQTYETAATTASACPGYHQHNQCEPWARAFKNRMDAQGLAVTLVGYTWARHGETVNHLVAFWQDKDGFWGQDNISGPAQVDSFGRYSWEERVANFNCPRGDALEPLPVNTAAISNIRIVE